MQTPRLKKTTHTPLNATAQEGKNGRTLPAVPVLQNMPIQQKEAEEKELLQAKFAAQLKNTEQGFPVQTTTVLQTKGGPEDEEPLQLKTFQLQAKSVQRQGPRIPEDEEPLQLKSSSLTTESQQTAVLPNNTGLPDNLKAGIENLSGFSLDDVKVHYNSDKPAQLQALAYAQGTDIHLGPGQEQHLPHEAWHVVQQKQGRVQPTMQMKEGIAVNDDKGLENEADIMGAKAINLRQNKTITQADTSYVRNTSTVAQRQLIAGRLNVAGEDHEVSDDRRDAERAFCNAQVPGQYWIEDTFPTAADNPRPADNLFLRSKFDLAVLKEENDQLLVEYAREPDADGDLTTTEATDSIISSLQENCEMIIENMNTEAAAGNEEAVAWLAENLASLENAQNEYQKGGDLDNPAILAGNFLDAIEGITTKAQASLDRGTAMDIAAKGQNMVAGVWKIGQAHIEEIQAIRAVALPEEQELYNLVSLQEFNDEFGDWVPGPPD